MSKRSMSTLTSQEELEESKSILNPWFVTGFTDGDGCFTISLTKDSKYSTGWRVKAVFSIGLKKEDLTLLVLRTNKKLLWCRFYLLSK